MLRAIPPKPSEERLPSKIIIISPIIIIPPLTISNMDIVFEGTFLLTIKAIIDITTAAAHPKTIS